MSKKLSVILMLLSLTFLGSLKAQEVQSPNVFKSLKYQGSAELDIAYPHVLGLSTTHGVVLKDRRFYLGLGLNAMALKPYPKEGEIYGFYIPSSGGSLDPSRPTGVPDYSSISEVDYLRALGLYSALNFMPQVSNQKFMPYGELRLGTICSFLGSTDDVLSSNFHGYIRLGVGVSLKSKNKAKVRLRLGLHIEYFSPTFAKSLHLADGVHLYNDEDDFEHKLKPFNFGVSIGLQF